MQKVLFLIGLIVLARATTLTTGAQSIIRQLQDFESQGEYGKQFAGLIQLHLEQGSAVEEVVDLVRELLDQMKNDQQVDDAEHASAMAQYSTEVETLNNNLDQMTQDLQDTNNLVVVLGREISALEEVIANLGVQLDVLNGKEEEIRTNRANDEIAYNRRAVQSARVNQAIGAILEQLTQAVFDEKDRQETNFLQRDVIVRKLTASLGAKHPVTLLVSVTTKFDVATVERIIEKLENIRDAVVNGQTDDDAHEVAAIQNFHTVVTEIEDVREKFSSDLGSSNQSLKRKVNEHVIAERTAAQLAEDIPLTQSILEDTQVQQEQYHSAYQVRAEQRSQEITIITNAFNLLNESVESVKRVEALNNQ